MFNLKGFRTLGLNALMAAVAVVLVADPSALVNNPEIAGYVVLAQSVGNMVLRFFTNTPPGKSTT
jgi:hypothetical protein